MINWSSSPFLRVSLCLSIGSLLGFHFSLSKILLLALLSLVLLLVLGFFISKPKRQGAQIVLIIFFLGMTNSMLREYLSYKESTEFYQNSKKGLTLYLIEDPVEATKTYKCLSKAQPINSDIKSQVLCYVYFKKDNQVKSLKSGDALVTFLEPEKIEGPKNPNEFNLKSYLHYKGIDYRIFLKTRDYKVLQKMTKRRIMDPMVWGDNCRSALKEIFPTKEVSATLEAMVFGSKRYLNSELKEAYSLAGASHLLAVSGLHMGIVYLILSFLTKPLDKIINTKWTVSILIVIALFLYALITGWASSAARAAIMLSIIEVGRTKFKSSSLLNSVGFAAFILLLLNPYSLFDMGFQLSFSALFGIAVIHPLVSSQIHGKPKIFKAPAELMGITLEATLGTFPFILFHFGKISLAGFFTNLFSGFIASLFLSGSLFLLTLSAFSSQSASLLAEYFSIAVLLWNDFIEFIAGFKWAVIDQVFLDPLAWSLLIGVLASLYVYLNTKWNRSMLLFLSLVIMVQIWDLIQELKEKNREEIVIFSGSSRNGFTVLWTIGNQGVLIVDSVSNKNLNSIQFRCGGHLRKRRIEDLEIVCPRRIKDQKLIGFNFSDTYISIDDKDENQRIQLSTQNSKLVFQDELKERNPQIWNLRKEAATVYNSSSW